MIQRPLDDITAADISALVENKVREARSIEYKLTLPGASDDDKREFLADVSSFANTAGGDLVFGVEATDGIPVAAPGLANLSEDKERLRLESSIRDGIDPRVSGVQLKVVPGFSSGPVLVVHIPKSWSSPHMVTFKGSSRFFTRSSAGKYQMDVTEIRSAFTLSEQLPERIRRWRNERLGRIIADETPVPLDQGGRAVLHMIPTASFANESAISAQEAIRQKVAFPPPGAGGWNGRINADGLLTHAGTNIAGTKEDRYCQVFRSGRLEAVIAQFVKEHDGRRLVPSTEYERTTIEAVKQYLGALKTLDVTVPIVVVGAIIGVKGAHIPTEFRWFGTPTYLIDRDLILLPDVLIEDYQQDIPRTLRPMFDALWNASGIPTSLNYDENGDWKPKG